MPPAGAQPDDLVHLEHAVRVLRSETIGVLAFDDHAVPIKFVTDPTTGHVVAPVMVAALEAIDIVLFIPEESDDALQLLLTPETIDGENHAAADRWRIYHGEPIDVRWARFHIEGARHGPIIIDGDIFMAANPIAAAEPAICKRLNKDKAALGRVCKRRLGTEIEDPVCVGADPDGIHIRARFGVVRIEHDSRMKDAEEAGRAVEAMLAE